MRGFHAEVHNAIDWLRREGKAINAEATRTNWRLIAAILQLEAKSLFVPPQ